MFSLEAISLSEIPASRLVDLCLSWEKILFPWLFPAQLKHLQSFGSSPAANRARLSRLLTRFLALNKKSWQEALDRDAQGHSFFIPSNSPAAFAYTKQAIFCLTASTLAEKDSLAIDAEAINELPGQDILNFLAKLYPSLHHNSCFTDSFMLAALWTAFESAYKIIGKEVFKMDLPVIFSNNFIISKYFTFHLSRVDLHFHFIKCEKYLITLAAKQPLPSYISCKWKTLPNLHFCSSNPLYSHA